MPDLRHPWPLAGLAGSLTGYTGDGRLPLRSWGGPVALACPQCPVQVVAPVGHEPAQRRRTVPGQPPVGHGERFVVDLVSRIAERGEQPSGVEVPGGPYLVDTLEVGTDIWRG